MAGTQPENLSHVKSETTRNDSTFSRLHIPNVEEEMSASNPAMELIRPLQRSFLHLQANDTFLIQENQRLRQANGQLQHVSQRLQVLGQRYNEMLQQFANLTERNRLLKEENDRIRQSLDHEYRQEAALHDTLGRFQRAHELDQQSILKLIEYLSADDEARDEWMGLLRVQEAGKELPKVPQRNPQRA